MFCNTLLMPYFPFFFQMSHACSTEGMCFIPSLKSCRHCLFCFLLKLNMGEKIYQSSCIVVSNG